MRVAMPSGRKVGMPRAHRRVLLVLLTGAGRLSGYPISRAGMVGSGHVYVVLARLEREGWVESEWDSGPASPDGGRRRFYRLTPYGRLRALAVLGLEPGQDGPGQEGRDDG